MAKIKVALNHPVWDGEEITFKASCSSEAADGLEITYPLNEDGTLETKTYSFRDAHGNNLSNTANVFASGSYVQVIVDTAKLYAFVQNADTNGYLEGKTPVSSTVQLSASGWANNAQTISLSGITAETLIIVSPAPNAENFAAYTESGIRCSAQSAGKITFECNDVPSTAVSVNIAAFG